MSYFYTLNNGVKIPAIGFGTWQIPEGNLLTMLLWRL